MEQASNRAERGAWLSIGAYVALSVMKIAIGYFFHSKALLADGFNNSTDIIASLAVLIGIRISRKPADADHKYGHTRAETVASLVASLIMVAVGIQVLLNSVSQFAKGHIQAPNLLAAAVALFSAGVMYGVYRYNMRLSRKTGSHALKAAAADNRSDMLVSLGTFVGILGSVLGVVWLDGLTAIIVAVLICKTGWTIFREASHMLTDGFDVGELEKFKKTVNAMDGVERVKDIKGRTMGNQVFVDLVIEVNQHMSVLESHEITENVELELRSKHRIEYVHVHIEPH